MNTTIKVSESQGEETVSYKNFIKGLNRTRSFGSGVSHTSNFKNPAESHNYLQAKRPEKSLRKRSVNVEVESVGEEGTAQIIRSPIVKRGKSTHSSVDLTNFNNLLETERNFKVVQDKLQGLTLENHGLKQENFLIKNHLKLLQRTIHDLQKKLENHLEESCKLHEKLNQMVVENGKLGEENERLVGIVYMMENESFRSEKGYLQDDLEAKILSLDKEKEEQSEMFQQLMLKYLSCLHEFANAEEWVISLIRSPYPKKELLDCEETLRSRYERLQSEISSCQSQLSEEKNLEKSYFTSMSSSIIPSPVYSPNRTLRLITFNDLSSSNKDLNN